jgi:hypothetical protein
MEEKECSEVASRVGWVERQRNPAKTSATKTMNFLGRAVRTYLRASNQGGTYFFTINLSERKNNDLLITQVDLLRKAFSEIKKTHPLCDGCLCHLT